MEKQIFLKYFKFHERGRSRATFKVTRVFPIINET